MAQLETTHGMKRDRERDPRQARFAGSLRSQHRGKCWELDMGFIISQYHNEDEHGSLGNKFDLFGHPLPCPVRPPVLTIWDKLLLQL